MALSLCGCFGPKPRIVQQQLQPPSAPRGPYTLVVTVENRSGGEGQAEIIARLRSRASGQTVAQESRGVELKGHETLSLTIPLQPARPGDYEAQVEARYPPE
jgi:hypothetical protein